LAIGLAGFSPPAAGSISGRSGRQSLSRAAFPLSCEFLMNDLADRLRHLPDDTLTALSFFSRLPVTRRGGSFDLRQGAGAWPIAGLLLALGPALLLWLLVAADFPALVAVLIALAAFAMLTGALHEDGLADTADGFGGGEGPDDCLAIMRDHRLGTFGALALLFSVLIRAAALAGIAIRPGHAALALVAAAILSRSMALWHWNTTMPARRDGLAWSAGRPDWLALAIGLAVGAVAALPLLIVFGLAALIGILAAAVAIGTLSSLSVRRIGGHTGDTIGAAQQIAETLLLAGLSIGWATIVL
jgi:adenosylcobinamide-GDP ribazoletransferase